jgi:hypothetical protein
VLGPPPNQIDAEPFLFLPNRGLAGSSARLVACCGSRPDNDARAYGRDLFLPAQTLAAMSDEGIGSEVCRGGWPQASARCADSLAAERTRRSCLVRMTIKKVGRLRTALFACGELLSLFNERFYNSMANSAIFKIERDLEAR